MQIHVQTATKALVLSLLLGPLASLVSGAESLSLDDAVRLGREHSRVVKAAEARAESAGEMRWEALGYLMPKVDLMGIAIRTEQPGEVFGLMMNRRDDMVGLMGQAFGMTADPSTGALYTMGMDNDVMVNPDPMNTYITRVQAEMPLFTGGMIYNRIRQANLMADATELGSERDTRQVDYDVVKAWTDLAKAREFLDLLKRSQSTTEAHVKMAGDYHEAGFLVSSEVLRAKVYLAEMDEMVTRADNGTRLALAALNFHLGIDQSTDHSLGSMPLLPSLLENDLDYWTMLALAERQDLEGARKQLKAGELEQHVAASAFLPTVGLQGAYDYYDDTLFGTEEGSYSIKAAVTFNVFKGGSDRARFAQARHNARAWREDVDRFTEGVKLQVQQAYGDYEAALLRHEASSASLDAARENLRVVEDRFREGVAKMIDLLDAETALRESEVRELVARYDSYLAAWRLRHAAGQDIVEINETEE
jgi:outer membrane protein